MKLDQQTIEAFVTVTPMTTEALLSHLMLIANEDQKIAIATVREMISRIPNGILRLRDDVIADALAELQRHVSETFKREIDTRDIHDCRCTSSPFAALPRMTTVEEKSE